MMRLEPPAKFNFVAEQWPEWAAEFRRFRNASKLSKEDECTQRDTLIYCMGREAEKIFSTFTFANDQTFDDIMTKFDDYFIVRRNVIYERTKFHERKQKSTETVEEFYRDLRDLAKHCNYQDNESEQIRDRMVVGLKSKKVREKLQLIRDLTLEKTVEIARQHEQLELQMKDESDHGEAAASTSEIRKRTGFNKNFRKANQHAQSPKTAKTKSNPLSQHNTKQNCTRCGKSHSREQRCPAQGKNCSKCGKPNHFAKCCRSNFQYNPHRYRRNVHEIDLEEDFQDLAMIDSVHGQSQPWMITLTVNDCDIPFKIDTGADVTVISEETFKKIRNVHLEKSMLNITSPGGKLDIIGEFRAATKFKSKKYVFRVVVVKQQLKNSLLSRTVATRLGLVKKLCSDSIQVNYKVFGTTGLVNTQATKIVLKEDSKPYNVITPRRVPFPLQAAVKEELDKMENAGIIEKTTTPTDWCAPMVPVKKKNGRIRICVDYKHLNTSIKRPHCMIPNLEDITPKMVGAKYFSTLDASGGFYQIPLDEVSSYLTTFITPHGRYRFKRVPMGISLGPETFQSKMEEILGDLEGCEPLSDDTIIYGRSEEEHDQRLAEAIKRIGKSGLRLNKEKCTFNKREVKYFGHVISEKGIRPDDDRVEAILKLKEPENVSELRTVLGMFNYMAKFVPQMSSILQPMSALLRKETSFLWGPDQQRAFQKAKEKISTASFLAFYDVNRPTIVSADASSYGIGGALLQLDGTKIVPIAFVSRTLSNTEKQYAQIEKECLAAVWCCEKFTRYLVGLPSFTLETDHKPLVPIMMKKDLDKTPIRCQRLLIRMMKFNAKVVHKAGKELLIADALSRFPLQCADDTNIEETVTEYVDSLEDNIAITSDRLNSIRSATVHDTELQQVMSYTLNGWPQRIPEHLIKYRQFIGDLSVKDGLLVMDNRIVIPSSQRQLILSKLHGCHQGLNKGRQLAQSTVWWPGLTANLKSLIQSCSLCRSNRPEQHKEPLQPTELPTRPWKQLGMDLLEFKGKSFLVVVDYYSRWIEILFLKNTTTTSVINKLKILFSTHGLPDIIKSDNGPQLVSRELKSFLKEMDIVTITSSPNFPQSNGMAESAVKIAKKILQQEEPSLALMNYRATPHSATKVSPAEALMNRKLRTQIPILEANLKPSGSLHNRIANNDRMFKIKAKHQYDKHNGATQPLSTLTPGDQVNLKDDKTHKWTTQGTVVAADPQNRTYLINTPSGVIRRNRRHLLNNENNTEEPDPNMEEQKQTTEKSPETTATTTTQTSPVSRNRNAPNIPNTSYPPTTPIRMRTRANQGYVAPKPARYKEEE